MHLVNLTGIRVRVAGGPAGTAVDLAPSGAVASVELVAEQVGELDCPAGDRVPVYREHPADEPKDLPPPVPGTVYVVPAVVARAAMAAGRLDVFAPGPPLDASGPDGIANGLLLPW